MQELSWAEWDARSQYRGVDKKYMESLIQVVDMYQEKLIILDVMLREEREKYVEVKKTSPRVKDSDINKIPDILFLVTKIARINNKLITCQKEIEGRDLGNFKRTELHHTDYYIDLDGGNDGSNGLGTGTAWLTLAKYTTTEVRTAGDIAYVRANTDETMSADLVFDEDGTADDYLEIIGCDSVTNDPWSDSSDVKPILTFGDGNYQVALAGDNFWKINRMIIKEGADTFGNLIINSSSRIYLLNSEFTDSSNASGEGVYCYRSTATLEGCTFLDNLSSNVYANEFSVVRIISSTFNGGTTTTNYGILAEAGSQVEVIDSNFGQTTAHDNDDVRVNKNSFIKLRNCSLGAAGISIGDYGSVIYEEDADGTFEDQLITYYHGTVTRDTGVTRSGGADSSAKMEPNTNCGVNNPLTLNNNSLVDSAFKIWCAASATTVTIYIRSLGTWGTYPTNTELYIETKYLDHSSNATRTAVASNDVLSDGTTWVAFDTTFTPQQAGWAYVSVYLKLFEDAGDGCYVDIQPVVS